MSRLKFSPNLFLEVNELQRFHKFLEDDGWKRMLKAIVRNFGIIENETNSYFKVTTRSGSNSVVIINAGIAFDSNLDAIVMNDDLELTVNNTGSTRWIVLSRGVTNAERGAVSVNSDGSLTGKDTEFTKVLRGQPNFPVKVKFDSTSNSGEYEVVSVTSDTSALLSGSFISQSDMRYSVVGTFTPGFQPADEDKMIYEYDSYNIKIIDSASRPTVAKDEFILARVSFSTGGGMVVADQRMRHTFNSVYKQVDGSDSDDNNNSINPLASLLNVGFIGGTPWGSSSVDLELLMEHGYTVTKHELFVTPTSNTFNIIEGQSNFLGTGNIPNGIFKGWLLVNRNNMKYAVIDDNTNKSLSISSLDSEVVSNNNKGNFIIVPNSEAIEYEVTVSNNVEHPSAPFYFKTSIDNLFTRARLYCHYSSKGANFNSQITVTVKYRLVDDGVQRPFNNLAIAQFNNVSGQPETLSKSSFIVDLGAIEPMEKKRNYS